MGHPVIAMARSHRGFTMVEMLVTMAVAGILLATAIPSFIGTLARSRIEGAANELAVDLQYARTEAVRRRTNATLQIASGGADYRLSYVNPASGASVNFKTVTLPAGVSATANASVQFSALRGLAAAQTVNLASTGTTATLRVATNATGRVQLCSPGGSFGGYATC